jgi:hypothetical protein
MTPPPELKAPGVAAAATVGSLVGGLLAGLARRGYFVPPEE